MSSRSSWLGTATIALAVLFNVPYAVLASIFDYPAILREPAAEVLTRFAEGGIGLLVTWYAFALAALALVPLATGLAITPARLTTRPALAIGAALAGAMAGLTQAIGLVRWVFVVPDLARAAASDQPAAAEAAIHTFALINAYGGVAIGEHLGQLLTALFAALLALLQHRERQRGIAMLGLATGALLIFGTGEGLMLAAGQDGSLFAIGTIAGFLALTGWLIATGMLLLRRA
ncbi:DUF4386 family protein [Polymorphobacter sp.]|uniref:DUF4386 family protein n=1 Tax=Polymorphobacter sp. TaxID=1909290 RepID=UPI003F727B39